MPRRNSERTNEIKVKVTRTGDDVQTLTLGDDRTIQAALDEAGYEYDEESRIRVNGKVEDITDDELELEDGDRVTLLSKVKGAVR